MKSSTDNDNSTNLPDRSKLAAYIPHSASKEPDKIITNNKIIVL